MAFARTVRESHIAEKTINNELKHNSRLGDIYEGIKWRLAREPDIGYRVPNTNPQIYVIHSYHWGEAAVVVAYHFDNDLVDILDLRVTPAE